MGHWPGVLSKRDHTDKVVLTGMYRYDYSDMDNVKNLANRLNAAGKRLAEGGVHLLYHNHNCEFLRLSDGESAYHLIQDETDTGYRHCGSCGWPRPGCRPRSPGHRRLQLSSFDSLLINEKVISVPNIGTKFDSIVVLSVVQRFTNVKKKTKFGGKEMQLC